MITRVASTVQLVQSHQGHVIWGQMLNATLGSGAEVDPVKAAATDVRNSLVGVGFGVPSVAAVLLPSQSLPHITDSGGQTHLGHLRWSPEREFLKINTREIKYHICTPLLQMLFGLSSHHTSYFLKVHMDKRLTSVSLRFVSPPNRTVTSSGASLILCITTRSCFMRSSAWPLQLSRWDVIRQNFWPLKSTWFQREKNKNSNLPSTKASWMLAHANENFEN